MYANASSLLHSQAPNVLVADCGFLLVGTTAGVREQRKARATDYPFLLQFCCLALLLLQYPAKGLSQGVSCLP
jgi:hypothetical protein